jgi:hypothetical protein
MHGEGKCPAYLALGLKKIFKMPISCMKACISSLGSLIPEYRIFFA